MKKYERWHFTQMLKRVRGERQELPEEKQHYREDHRRISDDLIWPEYVADDNGIRLPVENLPWYVRTESGLYERIPDVFLTDEETEDLEWRPTGNPDDPVLPFPFSARQLAAFFLAGVGAEFRERFVRDNPSTLDEAALARLGPDADSAREALREANRLYLQALQTNEGRRDAADWLLLGAAETSTSETPPDDPPKAVAIGAQVKAVEAEREDRPPMESTPLAAAFWFVPNLDKKLANTAKHRWVLPARVRPGNQPIPATWDPVTLAEILVDKRKVSEDVLHRAFMTEETLKPWRHLWQEARKDRNAYGT